MKVARRERQGAGRIIDDRERRSSEPPQPGPHPATAGACGGWSPRTAVPHGTRIVSTRLPPPPGWHDLAAGERRPEREGTLRADLRPRCTRHPESPTRKGQLRVDGPGSSNTAATRRDRPDTTSIPGPTCIEGRRSLRLQLCPCRQSAEDTDPRARTVHGSRDREKRRGGLLCRLLTRALSPPIAHDRRRTGFTPPDQCCPSP